MTIQEMHFGFNLGYNKISSSQKRNFLIPEIDFLLNKALGTYVDTVFFSRRKEKDYTFESSQKNIDSLRPLMVKSEIVPGLKIVMFPENYWHFVSAKANSSRGQCSKYLKIFPQQTEKLFQENSIYKSDFEWETLNATFIPQGLELYYDDFEVTSVQLRYLRKHPYMHFAEGTKNKKYVNLQNVLLTGHQNCELPDDACREITDLAVFFASSAVQDSGYAATKEILTLNQTI